MASGREHILWTGFMGAACLTANPYIAFGVFLSIPLSPDLDLAVSHPQKMVGGLFIPYSWCFKHRSIFTHSPILGTAGRLLYLCIPIFICWYMGLIPTTWQIIAAALAETYKTELLYVLFGLEAGACLHYAMDVIWSSAKRIF
jgi:uncharacterized metal-binding protein